MEGRLKLGAVLNSNSKRLLAIFIAIAVLTLGLGLSAGPDPRVKIYVLAKQETTNSLIHLIRSRVSSEIIFYSFPQEFTDLDLLVHTGCIKVILIADFSAPWSDSGQLLSFLDDVIAPARQVIIVQPFQNYEFASRIISFFPEKATVLSEREICDMASLLMQEAAKGARSYPSYEFLMRSTAISSLALVFVGATYCSSRILESGSKSLPGGIIEGFLVGGSVFIFIQWVYLMSSTTLETPISLHATTSQITAMSLIGPFGGGSVPRIIVSALGLTLGMFLVSREVEFRFPRFAIPETILGLVILIIVGIRIFAERNLLGSLLLRFVFTFYELLRIYPRPAVSRGVMMVFSGLVPLGAAPRMKSGLRSVFISFCMVAGSWGLMRVGDMRLNVSLQSFPPGIALGLLVSLIFLSADRAVYALCKRGFRKEV